MIGPMLPPIVLASFRMFNFLFFSGFYSHWIPFVYLTSSRVQAKVFRAKKKAVVYAPLGI